MTGRRGHAFGARFRHRARGDFAHWAQLTNGLDAQGREVGTVVNLGQRISKDTGETLGEAAPGQTATPTNFGAFVSSSWKAVDPYLERTGGARFDQHSSYGSQLTGRLGATSQWAPFFVTKLLYGSAFKAPSPYLLYAEPLRAGI